MKKIFAAIVLLFFSTNFSFADFDGDGKIGIADAIFALQISSGVQQKPNLKIDFLPNSENQILNFSIENLTDENLEIRFLIFKVEKTDKGKVFIFGNGVEIGNEKNVFSGFHFSGETWKPISKNQKLNISVEKENSENEIVFKKTGIIIFTKNGEILIQKF